MKTIWSFASGVTDCSPQKPATCVGKIILSLMCDDMVENRGVSSGFLHAGELYLLRFMSSQFALDFASWLMALLVI